MRVSDCDIETSDDSLCLRAAGGKRLLRAPCETAFVTVTNCTLSSCCEAFRIGVGDGPIHDFRVEGGTLREIVLPPDEYARRSADIDAFKILLY